MEKKGRKKVIYKPDRVASKMDNKEILHYLSGIKYPLWRMTSFGNKEYLGYAVRGRTYPGDATRFLLCALYIGLAATYALGKTKLKIPVSLIWKLSAFIDVEKGLDEYREKHKMVGCHKKVLEESFRILGYTAKLAIKDKYYVVVKKSSKIAGAGAEADADSISFDLKGEDQETFSWRLYLSTELGYF